MGGKWEGRYNLFTNSEEVAIYEGNEQNVCYGTDTCWGGGGDQSKDKLPTSGYQPSFHTRFSVESRILISWDVNVDPR
jgi:hypothetical protein